MRLWLLAKTWRNSPNTLQNKFQINCWTLLKPKLAYTWSGSLVVEFHLAKGLFNLLFPSHHLNSIDRRILLSASAGIVSSFFFIWNLTQSFPSFNRFVPFWNLLNIVKFKFNNFSSPNPGSESSASVSLLAFDPHSRRVRAAVWDAAPFTNCVLSVNKQKILKYILELNWLFLS